MTVFPLLSKPMTKNQSSAAGLLKLLKDSFGKISLLIYRSSLVDEGNSNYHLVTLPDGFGGKVSLYFSISLFFNLI